MIIPDEPLVIAVSGAAGWLVVTQIRILNRLTRIETKLNLKIIVLLATLLSFTGGCAAMQKTVQTLRPASTNYIPSIVTSSAGDIVTNVTTIITPAVTVTNVSWSPIVENGVSTVGNLIPLPGASAIAAGLLAISHVIFGFINKKRIADAQAKLADAHATHADAIGTADAAISTLVENFEDLRNAAKTIPGYQTIDEKVMSKVKEAQQSAGVQALIAKVVKNVT